MRVSVRVSVHQQEDEQRLKKDLNFGRIRFNIKWRIKAVSIQTLGYKYRGG